MTIYYGLNCGYKGNLTKEFDGARKYKLEYEMNEMRNTNHAQYEAPTGEFLMDR